MNERIKELINQMNQSGLPYGDNAMTVTDSDLEYFAELIVRECAQLARDTNLEDVEGGDNDVLRAAKLQIMEHFGVEE
jgi:hypothetical protein